MTTPPLDIASISVDMRKVTNILSEAGYDARQGEILLMFIVGVSLGITQTSIVSPPKPLLDALLSGWTYAVTNAHLIEE